MDHWTLSGMHYSRTKYVDYSKKTIFLMLCCFFSLYLLIKDDYSSNAWLKRLDANIDAVKEIMESFSGSKEAAAKWLKYWRGFCISGGELFGYNNGEEWMASHVLFKKK